MGQQQSQHRFDTKCQSEDASKPSSELLDQEIQRLRRDLQDLKQEGRNKQHQNKQELASAHAEFDDAVTRFLACDKQATSLFQFWDYLAIIRQEEEQRKIQHELLNPPSLSSSSPPTTTSASSSSSRIGAKASTISRPPSTALSNLSISTITTQFCIDLIRLFESYLLRKLHMAVLLETQRKKHAKGWNKVVMMYFRRAQDKAGKVFQKASQRASETFEQVESCKQERQTLVSKILSLQQEILDRLKQAPARRSSLIEDIRQSKRDLELLRYSISPAPLAVSRKVLDVTIRIPLVHDHDNDDYEEDEEKKDDHEEEEEERPQGRMPRRSSIEDIKARNRWLEQIRPILEVSHTYSDEDDVGPMIVSV